MAETNQITCPYCDRPACLVNGAALYPHRSDLYDKEFYACTPCDAHVGCHPGTTRPLGQPANRELRQTRMKAHAAFDELWRRTTPAGTFDRNGAYRWLAAQLGISREDCHIGQFDVETCRVVEAVEAVNKVR